MGHRIVLALVVLFAVSTMPQSPADVVVKQTDDGKSIVLPRNARLVVRLESQLGTGYSWSVEQIDAERLAAVGEPTIETREKQLPGSAEVQVFRFVAKAPGLTTLKLRYVRPWEKPLKPLKTFTLKVNVES